MLGLLVTRPQAQASATPTTLRNVDAIQIAAVIERPAVAPLVISRPAITVVVRAGQTIESLASEYGSDAAAIRWANGILGTGQPQAGMSLLLPPSSGALVRVLGGETPTSFATRLGLDPSTLLDFNALTTDNPLQAGTYLQVPLGGAPVGALIANRFTAAERGVPTVPTNHGADGFPYGQCTWYVASRRDVTWGGNAWVWWFAAAGIRPEGHVPVQGSIVVFRSGWAGHVAYVEHVNPDGSFLISEMNFYGNGGGWGRIDRRTIPGNDASIMGFIY
ncbi:MAG: CHAP domain-containing protein [Candidatus Dormibacteraeota bacterium]|nr:CHAP domain-containing protein [Candidatus Dormibacteraeota bacterium]MBV9526532.1 CHAP domain-containing protein [Candidatus Dormibacteraeota bacterium]